MSDEPMPGCSKNSDLYPSLENYPCMATFKEKIRNHLLLMQSKEIREEIQTKVKQKMEEKLNHNIEEMKLNMKKRFIDKLSEFGYFTYTVDTPSQTVDNYDLCDRPSDEFILTSEVNDMIRLDISDTHQWEVTSKKEARDVHKMKKCETINENKIQ